MTVLKNLDGKPQAGLGVGYERSDASLRAAGTGNLQLDKWQQVDRFLKVGSRDFVMIALHVLGRIPGSPTSLTILKSLDAVKEGASFRATPRDREHFTQVLKAALEHVGREIETLNDASTEANA